MRESISTAFQYTTVPYGDDNRLVRGIIARCGAPGCEAAIPLPVNGQRGKSGEDNEIEWQFIARKLQAKGWHIGKSHTGHRCPGCFEAAKHAAKRNGNMTNGNPMNEKLQVVNENMRVMNRDDRRLIFAKLNDVYVDDKTGYGETWTDEKVSTDLGVPRAWVRLVREENFGDEQGNDKFRADVKEASAVLDDIKAWTATLPGLQKLTMLAEKIEKSLAEIGRVLK
jgi:hypothetical protein